MMWPQPRGCIAQHYTQGPTLPLVHCKATAKRQSGSLGVRYSGQQYSTLDNSDVNGSAYTGASSYLVTDLRWRYRINPKTVASLGIDNLSDETYWNFHPYPQRTYVADLKANF